MLEAAHRDVGEKLVAVAEMPVRRSRTDAGGTCGLGEGEAGRALLGDQIERRLDQRFPEISVVIAGPAALFPAHVKGLYIIAGNSARRKP